MVPSKLQQHLVSVVRDHQVSDQDTAFLTLMFGVLAFNKTFIYM